MRPRVFPAVALLALTGGLGCQTVNPSALNFFNRNRESDGPTPVVGASSYTGGRAVQVFALPMLTVKPAVALALEDLRVENVRERVVAGAVHFEGTTTDKRRASVILRNHPVGMRLSARIGVFGDEPLTQFLLDRVGVRLGTLPPESVPETPPSEPGRNPYFSRSAVSDAIMLRDQADAPYRGTAVP